MIQNDNNDNDNLDNDNDDLDNDNDNDFKMNKVVCGSTPLSPRGSTAT